MAAMQRVAVGIAVGLLERLVDQMHAVIGADRHEIRPHAVIGLLEGVDEGLVGGRIVIRRIDVRGDGADHRIAHAVEQIVVGHVARADDLDAGLVHAALGELLDEDAALARRHEDEDRVRLLVGGALQERREIRIGEREGDGCRSTWPPLAVNSAAKDFAASAPGA